MLPSTLFVYVSQIPKAYPFSCEYHRKKPHPKFLIIIQMDWCILLFVFDLYSVRYRHSGYLSLVYELSEIPLQHWKRTRLFTFFLAFRFIFGWWLIENDRLFWSVKQCKWFFYLHHSTIQSSFDVNENQLKVLSIAQQQNKNARYLTDEFTLINLFWFN